jgi:hypothetical protein
MTKKKYILKPGKHQFAPKSPAVHDNDSLTDEEAEWYMERYPHIRHLFIESPQVGKSASQKVTQSVESSTKIGVIENENEDLPTTN